MDPVAGWTTIVVSAVVLLVAVFPLHRRLRPRVLDLVVAVSAVGVGVGGLLLLHDVGLASWIVAPSVLAVGAVVQVRVFWAGDGPFRT